MRYTNDIETREQNHRLANLGFTHKECQILRYHSRELQELGEKYCNVPVDEKRHFAAVDYNVYRIESIVQQHNLRISGQNSGNDCLAYYQSDPRGAAVYVIPLQRLVSRIMTNNRHYINQRKPIDFDAIAEQYYTDGIAVY
jgi:hypothetical protein